MICSESEICSETSFSSHEHFLRSSEKKFCSEICSSRISPATNTSTQSEAMFCFFALQFCSENEIAVYCTFYSNIKKLYDILKKCYFIKRSKKCEQKINASKRNPPPLLRSIVSSPHFGPPASSVSIPGEKRRKQKFKVRKRIFFGKEAERAKTGQAVPKHLIKVQFRNKTT